MSKKGTDIGCKKTRPFIIKPSRIYSVKSGIATEELAKKAEEVVAASMRAEGYWVYSDM